MQLPGREDRIREEPFSSLDEAVAEVSRDISLTLDGPFVIFGHSLGAVVATEVALRLELEHGRRPVHLFVSGSPGLPSIAMNRRPIHTLPDNELIAHVRELNGTPEEILADRTARSHVLRLIRADYTIFDHYTYNVGSKLSCPVTVFGGDADPTTTPTTLSAWSVVTTGPTTFNVFPGGHFFINSAQDRLLSKIRTTLGL